MTKWHYMLYLSVRACIRMSVHPRVLLTQLYKYHGTEKYLFTYLVVDKGWILHFYVPTLSYSFWFFTCIDCRWWFYTTAYKFTKSQFLICLPKCHVYLRKETSINNLLPVSLWQMFIMCFAFALKVNVWFVTNRICLN